PEGTITTYAGIDVLTHAQRSNIARYFERYAAITGLPIISVTGGTYTGVAATWVRTTVPEAMSFIIELGPTLSADEARVHATAVLDIITMV
ncbi:MAG: hypothetical protein ABMA25_29135, partial [Ilumatobacteraceae bacterium]